MVDFLKISILNHLLINSLDLFFYLIVSNSHISINILACENKNYVKYKNRIGIIII